MLHPACRDALSVGRPGSNAAPSSSSSSFLLAPSLQERLLQSFAETLTAVQRMLSTQETLDPTNGYKCVWKEIPGLSKVPRCWTIMHTCADAQFRATGDAEFMNLEFYDDLIHFLGERTNNIINTLVFLVCEFRSNISLKLSVTKNPSS